MGKKVYKAKYSGKVYNTAHEAAVDNANYLRARNLTEQTNRIPATYIGGTPQEARAEYWRQEPVMQHAVDSIAGRYGIDSDVLKYRLNAEGFTDDRISYRNYALKGNYINPRGYDILNSDTAPGIIFGLDDARDYILSGKVKLINENWEDADDFKNEQGRITHPVNGLTTADNIGITAAHLKYFKDQARKDFPKASDADLNRYSLAYYNRGEGGGKKWVKSGAKGYNYKAYGGSKDSPWNSLSMADKAAMMEVAIRNGITTLPEIRKAYNEFAEGGNIYSEENKLQQDVNIYPGGGWLGMMPAMPSTALSGGVDAIRKRLYENITPFGYHDPVSRAFNAVAKNQQDDTRADENKKIKKSDPQASALDAIWATYLNIPENQRRKINSRYGISKTKDGYYRFNNPGMIFDFERDLSSEGLYSLPGRKAVMMSGILGNYTTGLARDKKGDYMFYSDSRLNPDGTPNIKTGWDINPYSNTVDNYTEETTEERGQYGQNRKDWSYKLGKTLFGNVEDISMGIGTAVPIYDKIYLDDYYGVPQKERGGNYLPEVVVTGKKKRPYGGNLFGDGSYMEQAKALIRNNEGWRATPYKDAPKGVSWRSVGYGFNDSGFREKYPKGISKHYEHGITRAQAEQELDYYLTRAEKQLKGIYGKKWNSFTDGQKAAILDTYYQRPASVTNKSAFYNAVMSGKDPSKYLGVVGFDKRNNIRRNTFLDGFSGSYDIPQDAYTIQQYNDIPTTLFAPSNPEVFFGGYKAPEIEAPLPSVELEDTPQYSEEEIARQERRERLNNLSMLMSLTSPQGSSNSMLDALGLLIR